MGKDQIAIGSHEASRGQPEVLVCIMPYASTIRGSSRARWRSSGIVMGVAPNAAERFGFGGVARAHDELHAGIRILKHAVDVGEVSCRRLGLYK